MSQSSQPLVYVLTKNLRDSARQILAADASLRYPQPDETTSLTHLPESLLEVKDSVAGIYGRGPFDQQFFTQFPALKVIMLPSSGTDTVDHEAAAAHQVQVISAAGVAYVPVAEHVFGLALGLIKGIYRTSLETYADNTQSSNIEWLTNGLSLGVLHGRTMGLVGFGHIGRAVAAIASHGFGMRCQVYDPYLPEEEQAQYPHIDWVSSLDAVLTDSDVVSIHCPLTPATTGLIGARELGLMPPTSILINTARGPIVSTEALIQALDAGTIAGAGLDVTEPEPLPANHPLFGRHNVVLTPHIGGISPEYLEKMMVHVAKAGTAVLTGAER